MKKLVAVLITLVMVIGCSVTPGAFDIAAGKTAGLAVTIDSGVSRGQIDVDELMVISADITVTLPGGSTENATWTSGGSDTFYFSTVETGMHTVSISETDMGGNTNTFSTDFNVTVGNNYSITITLGGNIYVEVIHSNVVSRLTAAGAEPWGGSSGSFNVEYQYGDGSSEVVNHSLFTVDNDFSLSRNDVVQVVSNGGGGGGAPATHTLSFFIGGNETVVTTFTSASVPSSGTVLWP
jgi:hypothetical protein